MHTAPASLVIVRFVVIGEHACICVCVCVLWARKTCRTWCCDRVKWPHTHTHTAHRYEKKKKRTVNEWVERVSAREVIIREYNVLRVPVCCMGPRIAGTQRRAFTVCPRVASVLPIASYISHFHFGHGRHDIHRFQMNWHVCYWTIRHQYFPFRSPFPLGN